MADLPTSVTFSSAPPYGRVPLLPYYSGANPRAWAFSAGPRERTLRTHCPAASCGFEVEY
jgi:hypothetical protein